MTRSVVATIVTAILAGSIAPAVAAPRTLTLHDALTIALARNPTLASARISVLDAEARQLHARGAYEPTLELNASAQDSRHDPQAVPFVQELRRDQVAGTATITKPFEDGSQLAVRVGVMSAKATTRLPNGDTFADLALLTVTPTIEATFSEPLWGGRRVGEAEVDELHAARGAARCDELATVERVVHDAEQAYWQLYLAQQELAIHRQDVDLAEGQLRVVQSEIGRGARPAHAAAEVEEELARRREDELVAHGAVAERSIALARLLGLQVDAELVAIDTPPTGATTVPDGLVQAALAHSPMLQAAIVRGDGASFELAKVEDTARWRIDAYAHGALSQPADHTRDALAATAGYGGWTVDAGLTIKLPLGESGVRGATDSARAQLVRQRIEVADLEAQVAAAATSAVNHLALAVQRRAALTRSVELARQNLDAEQRRWERGDTTSYEVLRRQAALADTELRAARARVDELAAETDIDALTGDLLTRRHLLVNHT